MQKILVITPNNFSFDKSRHYKNIDNILSDISPCIEEKNIPIKELMDEIVTSLHITPDIIGDSPIYHESCNNVYQICHIGSENDIAKTLNKNEICSHLKGEIIVGNGVLINSKISPNKTCESDDMDINRLANILHSKFVHKAIHLGVDGSIKCFDYFETPNENHSDYKRYIDVEFLGINFGFYIDDTKDVNKQATRLYGTKKIFGNVIVILKNSDEYLDLDLKLYNKVNAVAYGYLWERELAEWEKKKDDDKNKDLKFTVNKYNVIDERYKKKEDVCNDCHKGFQTEELGREESNSVSDFETPRAAHKVAAREWLMCTGCYRMKYHSIECQQSDWARHKKDCLFEEKK